MRLVVHCLSKGFLLAPLGGTALHFHVQKIIEDSTLSDDQFHKFATAFRFLDEIVERPSTVKIGSGLT